MTFDSPVTSWQLLILCGETDKVRGQLSDLRLEMGDRMGLRNRGFNPLWVVDFPLLEWDEDSERFHAMHHPFTSPKEEDKKRTLKVRALSAVSPQNTLLEAHGL